MNEIIYPIRRYGDACFGAAIEVEETGVLDGPKMKDEIVQMAHTFEMENDAAHDLWTWLPSHKEAEKYHGDYASEFMPSVADVMIEATLFIAHKLNPSDVQRREAGEMYLCPCGEPHDEEAKESDNEDAY